MIKDAETMETGPKLSGVRGHRPTDAGGAFTAENRRGGRHSATIQNGVNPASIRLAVPAEDSRHSAIWHRAILLECFFLNVHIIWPVSIRVSEQI